MRKIRAKTTYRTEDGRQFTDETAAAAHETLVQARAAYEEAKHALGKLLAEQYRTADGEPFTIAVMPTYYYITPGTFSLPRIMEVDFWGRNWEFKEGTEESDDLVLIDFKDDHGGKLQRGREIPIVKLYFHRANAERALRLAKKAWLEACMKELEEKA